MRSPHAAMKNSPRLLQLEKAWVVHSFIHLGAVWISLPVISSYLFTIFPLVCCPLLKYFIDVLCLLQRVASPSLVL